MSAMSHEHDEMDECVQALARVHAFLHNELVEADTLSFYPDYPVTGFLDFIQGKLAVYANSDFKG